MEEDEGYGNEEGPPRGAVTRHLSKRVRRNKGLVVVFDPDARKQFVTGFHKRKKKRRKLAEKQKQLKVREKRLEERKERRLALKRALGEVDSNEAEEEPDVTDQNQSNTVQLDNGTIMYEDEDMTTIVNTHAIELNDDLQLSNSTKKPEARKLKHNVSKSEILHKHRNLKNHKKRSKH